MRLFSKKFIAGIALAGLIIATPAISSEIEAQGTEEVAAIVPIELAIELGVEWKQLTDNVARVEIPKSTFEEISEGEYRDQVSEDILYQTFSSYDTLQPPVTSGKVNVPAEFDGTSESTGLPFRVAVLDTGVERGHPYLLGKIAQEVCFTTNQTCPNGTNFQVGAGASATVDSHGTHVSGIIVGNTRTVDSKIYEGVAPGAEVISVKVCDGDCSRGLPYSSILSGLQWVLDNHVEYRIVSINMSFGGGGEARGQQCDSHTPTTTMMANLWAAGVAPVGATGNAGNFTQISHPACVSNVIAVGSTTGAGDISSFSNISPRTDLLAQGSDVFSSVLDGQMENNSGTSMATPVVAAAIAVLRSVDEDNTLDNYLEVLRDQSDRLEDVYVDDLRRVRIDRAAQYLLGTSKPEAPTNLTFTQIDKDFAEVGWNPVADVDGYVVSVGNQVFSVDSGIQSFRVEIDDSVSSLVAAVAASRGGVVSSFVQTPTLTLTTRTTRPSVKISGVYLPNICIQENKYEVQLQVSHSDTANVTGFVAWNVKYPTRIFKGSPMNFQNEWDSNITVITTPEPGQIRAAAVYRDGSTGASRLVSYGNAWSQVQDGPVATSFDKVTGEWINNGRKNGWRVRWIDPLTSSGLADPKIYIYAGSKKLAEANLGVGEAFIEDPNHTHRSIDVCIHGLRSYEEYTYGDGSKRSTFDTAKELPPTAVGIIRATSPSAKKISTTFSAASTSLAAPVLFYQVLAAGVTSRVPADSRSLVQTVPHPGEYEVSVRASNANGYGPWVKTKITVQGSASSVISSLKVSPGNREAKVSWKVASSQSAAVSRQEVTIGSRKISVSRTARSLTVKDLAKGSRTICVLTYMNSGAKVSSCSTVNIK